MDEPRPADPTADDSAPCPRSREHWVVLGVAVLTILGFLALGILFTPDERGHGTHQQLGLQPCFPAEMWNIPCPGCGVTTSMTLATHGHLWQAIVNQPFGFVVWLAFLAFALWAPIAHFCGRDLWIDIHRLPYGPILRWLLPFAALAWVYKLAMMRGWFG